MAGRTFSVGDIHGEIEHLLRVLNKLPELDESDTLVFLGDYLDRGPHAAQVVEHIRRLAVDGPAKVVCLRGNHEDAWLKVIDKGFDEFVFPPSNGCLATMRSFTGGPLVQEGDFAKADEMEALFAGSFFPPDVVAWMRGLPYYYEDEHAIYVHAGLPEKDGRFLHPREVPDPVVLLWLRTQSFFKNYRGKPVVFGHSATAMLPQELSQYTPDDPTDLFAGEAVFGLDTGCGTGGFLSVLELPSQHVYESRELPLAAQG
ncbi:MAG: metallophosphoesterase family protein [Myxococcales bacterium]